MNRAILPAKAFTSKAHAYEDLVGYAMSVGDGLILNADGALMRSWRFKGRDLDSSSSYELVAQAERINDVIRRLPVGWMLHVDSTRRPAIGYPIDSRFEDRTSWFIDETRRLDYNRTDAHYVSDQVLTATYLCPRDTASKAWAFFRDDDDAADGQQERAAMHEALKEFRRGIDIIESGFHEDLGLVRLGNHVVSHPHERWIADGQLQHLIFCATGIDLPIRAKPCKTDLAPVIANQHLRNGDRLRIGDNVVGILTVADVPSASCPGIFDVLNRQACTYRVSHRFIVEDTLRAKREIENARRKHFQGRKSIAAQLTGGDGGPHIDGDAYQMASDASAALDNLKSGNVVFGYWTMCVVFMETIRIGETEASATLRLNSALKDTASTINRLGFVTRDEDNNTLQAFLGTLPGRGHPNLRRSMLSSRNLADFLPITSVWAGESVCPCPMYPPQSPPLAVVRTGTTPYYLNLHVGDVGHTMVVGRTGGGKSTLLAFLLAQHRRYARSRQIAIDLGYSLYTLCESVGGNHHVVSAAGEPTFAPLEGIDDPRERAWAESWVGMLLQLQGVDPNPRRESIYLALEALANSPKRSLTDLTLTPFLDNEAKRALRYYTIARDGGGLLDAEQTKIHDHDFTVFEMEAVRDLGKEMALPTLTYIFHLIETWLRSGQPTLLTIDEMWSMLDDPAQSAQIKNWLKTFRKKNTSIVFATQSLEDLLESSISATLTQSCLTKIFLANPEALSQINRQTYRSFGLTDWQIQMLSKAIEKRDYYIVQPSGRRMISLDLNDAALAFLGVSDPRDIRKVRALLEQDSKAMELAGTPEVTWWPATWLAQRAGEEWAQLWIDGPQPGSSKPLETGPTSQDDRSDAFARGLAYVA